MPLSLTAAVDDDGRRLDRILRKVLPLPLSAIHRLLRKGAVLVNGETADPARRIWTGETITVTDPACDDLKGDQGFGIGDRGCCSLSERIGNPHSFLTSPYIPHSPFPIPHSLSNDIILFEGAGLLVLNKPAGLEVHGSGSLEEQVRSYLAPKLPPSLSFRPGPLHRLDKPSSGVIAFSTTLEGARFFSALMRERKIRKYYLALVEGNIEKEETWRDELIRDKGRNKTFAADPGALMVESVRPSDDFAQAAGKTALTRVRPLAGNGCCTLVMAEIETGRTHQIRAQAAARLHPLLYDKKYGGSSSRKDNAAKDRGGRPAPGESFLLHAWRMEFPANIQGGVFPPRLIEAPLPGYFQKKIRELFGEDVII